MPCITGQLSFSLIGSHTDATTLNLATSTAPGAATPVRYVAVAAERRSSDLPLPGWFVQGFRRWATCDFILVAKTAPAEMPVWNRDVLDTNVDHMGVLHGDVFVIPHHVDGTASNRVNALRHRARNDINSYSADLRSSITEEDGDQLIQGIASALSNPPEGVRIPHARFRLYRSGELRIWLDPTLIADAHEVGVQVDDAEAGLGPALCRQIYYFIKDTTHRHYHHDQEADNILPLTPAPKIDDISWRRETLWALVRAVLEGRRRSELYAYKDALGVLAYADAFQGLLARIRRPAHQYMQFEEHNQVALYSLGPTKSSIEAKREELTWTHGQRFQLLALIVASSLAVAALWIASVQVESAICRAAQVSSATLTTLVASPESAGLPLPENTGPPVEAVGNDRDELLPAAPAQTLPDRESATDEAHLARPCDELMPPSAAILLRYFVQHPFQMLAGGAILAVWITLFVGRGLRSFPAYRQADRFVRSFALAMGATVARRIRPFAFAAADPIGAWLSAFALIVTYAGLFFATAALIAYLTR